MTPREERFVEEYLLDRCAKNAAIRAGYAKTTAKSKSFELLRKPHIAEAISAAQSDRAERLKVSQDYVLKNLMEVAERCLQKVPVLKRKYGVSPQGKDKDGNQLWAFSAANRHTTDDTGHHLWTFDARGATRALELIGKHLGMFVDHHQVDHVHYAVSAEPDPQSADEWQKRFKTHP